MQKSLKKTIVFVSHDLDEALKLGNHIAIMEAGRIVQYGEPEEIVLNPANQYVAEFVAHMNTINVLRGRSLMTRIQDLPNRDGALILDWSGQNRLTLAADGSVESVTVDDKLSPLGTYVDGEGMDALDKGVVVLASPDIRMRTAIELRHCTGTPVIFVEDGKVVGVIGDDEIYRGILRQSTVAT